MVERISLDDLFDRRLTFPDRGAQRRFARLVGIDDAKTRLTKLLGMAINPARVRSWLERHYKGAMIILDLIERRPPLVVLAGDVGTGKTELAETVGDAIAREENIEVTLFPLSLAARGSGRVGEMTKLISSAFEETVDFARRLKRDEGKSGGGVILLVDEADALTQSRDTLQMHHEDRAGVNAFIRGVDRLAEQRLPAAVILCTNRLGAIDPAVQRRAAQIFEFTRPNNEQRRAVLEPTLSELEFGSGEIDKIVELTGPSKKRSYGFTYSDLTQRFLPTLVLDAYPSGAVSFKQAIEAIKSLRPTPPFGNMTETTDDEQS